MRRASIFVFVCFFALSTFALAGAPLKGVDIKLGKNPGGGAQARTTDAQGNAQFGVLPAGSYYMIVSAPKALGAASVTVGGATGTPVAWRWDFGANTAVRLDANAAAKGAPADRIVFDADGVHPVVIQATTIVKSKSNISNN